MKPTIKNYLFLHVAFFDIFYHYGLHEMGG